MNNILTYEADAWLAVAAYNNGKFKSNNKRSVA